MESTLSSDLEKSLIAKLKQGTNMHLQVLADKLTTFSFRVRVHLYLEAGEHV